MANKTTPGIQDLRGNIGIGTANPQKPLHIQSANDAPVRVESTDATTGILFVDPDGSNALYYVGSGDYFYTSSKLGIGTTNPSRKLSVETNDTATYSASVNASEISIARKNSSNTAGQVAAISLNATGWSGQTTGVVVLNAIARQGNFSNADFAIQNRVGGNFVETFRITTYGNVGIGTDTPDDNVNTGAYFKPDGGGRFLTVKDSSGSFIMLESSTTTDDDQIGGIYFNNTGGQADAHVHVAGIDAILHKNSTNDALSGGDLRFFTKPSGSGVNSPRMVILQNGNVGIGTTNPGRKLTVQGADDGTMQLRLMGTASQTSYWDIGREAASTGQFRFIASRTGTVITPMVIDDQTGNVGIGTTGPVSPLDVRGAGATSNPATSGTTVSTGTRFRIASSTGATAVLDFGISTSGKTWLQSTDRIDLSTKYPLLLNPNGGNVGIGTADPDKTLTVGGTNTTHGIDIKTKVGTTVYKLWEAEQYFSDEGYQGIYYGNVKKIQFRANGDSYFNGGNVGIGTTGPTEKLTIFGGVGSPATSGTGANGNLAIESSNGNSLYFGSYAASPYGCWMQASNYVAQGIHYPIILNPLGGNVGVGTDSPAVKLQVSGNASVGTIGTPKSDWWSAFNGIQIGDGTTLWGRASDTHLSSNYYAKDNSGTAQDAYINTNYANDFWLDNADGTLTYRNAASGTAGTTITWNTRLKILNNGNVGIGTTNPGQALTLGANKNIRLDWGGGTDTTLEMYYDADYRQGIKFQGNARRLTIYNYRGDGNDTDLVLINGNVGIGTTSPNRTLTVNGVLGIAPGVTDVPELVLSSDANGTYISSTYKGTSSYQPLVFEANGSERMRINDDGNVGIGTDSPGAKLDVNGEVYVSPNTAGKNTFTFTTNASNDGRLLIKSDTTTKVDIQANGDSYFNGGNVGIGTTAPNTPLEVRGSSGEVVRMSMPNTYTAGAGPKLSFWNAGGEELAFVRGVFNETNQGNRGNLLLGTRTSDALGAETKMTILHNGNVGIGVTSPGAKLDVRADAPSTSGSIIYVRNTLADGTNNTFGGISFFSSPGTDYTIGKLNTGGDSALAFRNANNGTEYMRITSSGNVGIGTTSPRAGEGTPLTLESSTGYVGLTLSGTGSYANVWQLYASGDGSTYNFFGIYDRTNSAYRLVTTDSGNVGIGTTAPKTSLHVAGQGNRVGGNIQMGSSGDGSTKYSLLTGTHYNADTEPEGFTLITGISTLTDNVVTIGGFIYESNPATQIQFYTHTATTHTTGGTEKMRITSSGNVGIGTTSPAEKLDVDGDIALKGTAVFNFVSPALTIGDIAGTDSVTSLKLTTADDSTTVYLDDGGNVGIGTTAPLYPVVIADRGPSGQEDRSLAIGNTNNTGTFMFLGTSATTGGYSVIQSIATEGVSYGDLILQPNGANVGIGTNNPQYKLTVSSGTEDIGILTASSDSGSYVGFLDNATSVIPKIGAVGNKLILDASQYVGIKRTDPSYALDVSGTIRATGDVIAYSDARVKENVETIPNALDKIKAMRGVGYNKIGEEKRSIGVIAQEMLEVMPEVVSQDEQGMYSVAYGNLVGVLIEAVKDLESKVEQLQNKIDGIAS